MHLWTWTISTNMGSKKRYLRSTEWLRNMVGKFEFCNEKSS